MSASSPPPADAPAAPIAFGPFQIDRAEARLLRDGRPVALTPKAFDVLYLLASRADRLVSKRELLDTIWPDVLVSDASVKVCVREIRKALDDDADAPRYIETVHRRGYRFVAGQPAGSTSGPLPHPDSRATLAPPAADAATSSPTDASPSVETPAALAASAAIETTLVGREAELRKLEMWFDRAAAAAGERQCVFVTGGPGTGKTAVVEFFLRWTAHAVRPGAATTPLVLSGHCFQQFGMAEPYMPVWDAIGRAARERAAWHAAPKLAILLARHAAAFETAPGAALSTAAPSDAASALAPPERGAQRPAAAASEPRARSERLLREIADGIESLAGATPVILLLEDVQWADYSTLDLISALARRRAPARLMVIATYRPGELSAPTAAGGEHPLRDVTRGLLGARLCHELSLPFLDEANTAEYLAARFPGAALPPALARRLHHRTDGHPLFLVQLVNDLVEQGILVQRAGRWRIATSGNSSEADGTWPATVDTQVPRTVRAMIGLQLERLDAPARAVLEAAAVAGVEFSAASVAAALGEGRVGGGASEVVAAEHACDELARRHHLLQPRGLAEWPDGTAAARYRFAHELYHSVVYEQVPPARRARMHAAIGARLEAGWGDRAAEAAAELAMHFETGRDWCRAVHHLRQAAAAAGRQYAHREAVNYLRRALAVLERLPPVERAKHELPVLMSLGVNLQVTRGFAAPEVQEIHARAHALCQASAATATSHAASGIGNSHLTFPVVWGIWLYHKVRSDLRRADEMSHQLLAMARDAGDPALLLQAHQAVCVTSLCLGNPGVTCDHMDQAAAAYDPAVHSGNTEVYGQDPGVATLAFGSIALWLMGRADDAVRAGRRAGELAKRLGQPSSLALATHFAAMLAQLRGDVAATRQLAQATIELSREEGFSFWLAGGTILRGWADAVAESAATGQGIADIRGGLDAWLATGSRTYHTYFLGLLADALLRQHHPVEALATLDEALAAAQELPEGLYEAELYRLKARALLEIGDDAARSRADASQALNRALAVARSQGATWLAGRAASDLEALGPLKRRKARVES